MSPQELEKLLEDIRRIFDTYTAALSEALPDNVGVARLADELGPAIALARILQEPREDLPQVAEYWREQERDEREKVIGGPPDSTMVGLLIRCGYQYTRGLADGLEWACGKPDQLLDWSAEEATSSDD